MQESIDQALTHVRGIWNYRWSAVVAAWLIAVVCWVGIHYLPDQYKASTRVYIDSDSVLRPLLKGLAVETNVEQQLKLLTRTLLSRPNIEKIMRMTDLDIQVNTPSEKDALISHLTSAIQIRKMGRERGINLYQITYMHHDRKLAKRVVQALLTILMEASLGNKREDSNSAKIFLAEQIADYETRLVAAEDRLARYKQKNIGVLPGQGGGYYNSLKMDEDHRDQAKLELNEAIKRRDSAQEQLEELIVTGQKLPESVRLVMTPLDTRILTLQTKLDEMLLKYTQQHPSVQDLEDKITALEVQQKKESQVGEEGNEGRIRNTPLYYELKLALAKEEANIAGLRSRVQEYSKRIGKLQTQVEIMPQIEAELKRLDRDYLVNKKNYDTLLSRRESANLAARVEQAGNSIKFRVIDPPWAPYTASEPQRLMLNSMTLAGSIVAGLALAFLFGQVRPVIYAQKDLQELTGIPVWGGVSLILSDREVAANTHKLLLIIAVVGLLFVAYIGVMLLELKQLGRFSGLFQMVGL